MEKAGTMSAAEVCNGRASAVVQQDFCFGLLEVILLVKVNKSLFYTAKPFWEREDEEADTVSSVLEQSAQQSRDVL